MTYEDELPEDITDEEYALWFDRSAVDGVRFGPSIEDVRSLIDAKKRKKAAVAACCCPWNEPWIIDPACPVHG